jgi:hypothetical protein
VVRRKIAAGRVRNWRVVGCKGMSPAEFRVADGADEKEAGT